MGWIVLPMWLAALIAFHIGLLIVFVALFYVVRGKTFQVQTGYGNFGPAGSLLIGVVTTFLSFVLMCYFNMFDTLEVSITSLQLGMSSIALLVGTLKARRKKSDS